MKADDRLNELHADLCKVFTSPARIQILNELREGEKSVGQLVDATGLPQPNVSQHLAVMRNRGILMSRKEGAVVHYKLANTKVLKAFDIIREVLHEGLAANSRLAKEAR